MMDVGGAQVKGHRPDTQQEARAPDLGERLALPSLDPLGNDLAFAQVPRAFVNLVKVLEIINLRQLYQDKNVSCPRLILR